MQVRDYNLFYVEDSLSVDTILCPKRVSDCDCTLGNDTDRKCFLCLCCSWLFLFCLLLFFTVETFIYVNPKLNG